MFNQMKAKVNPLHFHYHLFKKAISHHCITRFSTSSLVTRLRKTRTRLQFLITCNCFFQILSCNFNTLSSLDLFVFYVSVLQNKTKTSTIKPPKMSFRTLSLYSVRRSVDSGMIFPQLFFIALLRDYYHELKNCCGHE